MGTPAMADRGHTGELWQRFKARRDGAVRERLPPAHGAGERPAPPGGTWGSASRSRTALSYVPLVRAQARHMAGRVPPSVRAEDLEGYGMAGRLGAMDRFRPDRGIP